MLIQVGAAALRSPSGEFLPSVPIMQEVPEKSQIAELSEQEVEEMFYERTKQYFDAGKALRKKYRLRRINK